MSQGTKHLVGWVGVVVAVLSLVCAPIAYAHSLGERVATVEEKTKALEIRSAEDSQFLRETWGTVKEMRGELRAVLKGQGR